MAISALKPSVSTWGGFRPEMPFWVCRCAVCGEEVAFAILPGQWWWVELDGNGWRWLVRVEWVEMGVSCWCWVVVGDQE